MNAGLLRLGLTVVALLAALWPWTVLVDGRRSVRLLTLLVFASASIVAVETVLGAFGALTGAALRVTMWSVVAAAALGGGIVAVRRGRSPQTQPERPSALGISLGAVAVTGALGVVFVGTLVPPYGWDTLVYHLTTVYRAAQSGDLSRFPFPDRVFYFPQVGELHSLFAFLVAGGEDAWRWTGLALLPFGLMAGVAVRVAAEGLGLRAARPWLAPAMFLAPVVLIQPVSGYVDVAFAAFVLAAFAYAALAAREGRFVHLALCSFAAGLALGVKISLLYYGLPIAVLLLSRNVGRALASGGFRSGLARLVVCVVLFLAGSAPWLGRNLATYGNPLYPVRVELGGRTILDGPQAVEGSAQQESWFVERSRDWWSYPFRETFAGGPTYSLENGFGPLAAAGFLVTLPALVVALRRRRGMLARALLALPLTVIPWFVLSPYREPRYVIAACGFALLAVAVVQEMVAGERPAAERGWARSLPAFVLRAAIVVGVLFGAAGGLASAAPDLPAVLAQWSRGEWSARDFYPLHYGDAGRAFNWLAGEDRVVTFTNPTFLAPLYGWDGSSRVVYAPTVHDPPVGEAPRRSTYRGWRHFLHESGTEWIVVWIPWWESGWPNQRERWIEANPSSFRLVRAFGERARVYAPVFGAEEIADLEKAGGSPDLEALGSAQGWVLEYETGAATALADAAGGGVELEYEFLTTRNDYCDYLGAVDEADWSRFRALEFDLACSAPAPALLFVYLKERDPRRACRFRVNLADLEAGLQRVSCDLAAPEWRTPDFHCREVTELHLVLDDIADEDTVAGTIRVRGFELVAADVGSGETAGEDGSGMVSHD
jgi:hypothetical protein